MARTGDTHSGNMRAMDENPREMKDRHSRDEARLRQQQQHLAGGEHSPVEAYPPHGAHAGPTGPAADGLVSDYEDALAREHTAWEQVKTATEGEVFAAAWDHWRAAVEERDRATRMLINQSLQRAPG